MTHKTTQQAMDDHLEKRRRGLISADIDENYTDDIVVLSHLGHFQGKESFVVLARLLDEQLQEAEFLYNTILIDGDFAFLQWSAHAKDFHVSDGADSYLFRDGRICKQTIYYSLNTNPGAQDTVPPT